MMHLPQIKIRNSISYKKLENVIRAKSISNQHLKNPFRFPTDKEIFMSRDEMVLKKSYSRNIPRKVWEKYTASTRSPLKRVNPEMIYQDIGENINGTVNIQTKKGLTKKAFEIIQLRSPLNERSTKKLVEFVQEKKDILHMVLQSQFLKKEIHSYQENIQNKEFAYNQAQQTMNNQKKSLQELLERDINASSKKIAELDQQIIKKNTIEEDMYKIKLQILSEDVKLKKMNNIISNFMLYKEFVDSISPSEWIAKREKEFEQKLKDVKRSWINRKNSDDPNSDELSVISKSSYSKKSNPGKGSPSMAHKKLDENFSIKHLALKEFEDLLSKDLIKGIKIYERELYFKNPKELHDLIQSYEEKNLFKMEVIDQLQIESEEKSKNLIMMKKNHTNIKNASISQLNELTQKMSDILLDTQHASTNKFIEQRSVEIETLGILKSKIQKMYKKIYPKIDCTIKSSIEMMKDIEEAIYDKITRIREFDQTKVFTIEKKIFRMNKELLKEEINKKEFEEKEKKKMITYERMNKPIPLVFTKKLMKKSPPLIKQKIKEIKEEITTQNDDKYFL